MHVWFSVVAFIKNKGKIMIQTIPRRGRKQPKWDPSQNRQKQPLPKPKTTRKSPTATQKP